MQTDITAPAIVVADDQADFLALIEAELRSRYGTAYRIVAASAADAGTELESLRCEGVDVALVLADRTAAGTELLAAVPQLHPHARKALLLQAGESRIHREVVVDTLARGLADYWVDRPAGSPDERFHRAVTEFLDEWWRQRGSDDWRIKLVGDESLVLTHELRDFLQRHDAPYSYHPADTSAGRSLLERAGVTSDRLPVVVLPGSAAMVAPSRLELAEALGARVRPGEGVYDVAVVGGGPAGLATAVYAGSEGLRTALIEREAMGGQAGTSSLIRNYLGFPRGISGAELAARAFDQAVIFGTEMVYGGDAVGLRSEGDLKVVALSSGIEISARAVVVATGVSYRRLDVPALEPFVGTGVFYGGGMAEAKQLTGERVVVVGGGNSAGQAALHLARYAEHVDVVVRSNSLAASMSEYLVKDLATTPNIDVRFATEVVGGGGGGRLAWVELHDGVCDRTTVERAAAVFVLVGGTPHTDWLPPDIERDDWGYITASTVDGAFPYETTLPGVFAVGDVRHGSIKRVAAAAGEGAGCVRSIHDRLQD